MADNSSYGSHASFFFRSLISVYCCPRESCNRQGTSILYLKGYETVVGEIVARIGNCRCRNRSKKPASCWWQVEQVKVIRDLALRHPTAVCTTGNSRAGKSSKDVNPWVHPPVTKRLIKGIKMVHLAAKTDRLLFVQGTQDYRLRSKKQNQIQKIKELPNSAAGVVSSCTQICGMDLLGKLCSKISFMNVYLTGQWDYAVRPYVTIDNNRLPAHSDLFNIFKDDRFCIPTSEAALHLSHLKVIVHLILTWSPRHPSCFLWDMTSSECMKYVDRSMPSTVLHVCRDLT